MDFTSFGPCTTLFITSKSSPSYSTHSILDMTSRPKFPPSTGRPRLPISMDDNFKGSRALPSPTSPTFGNRPFPQVQEPEHHPRNAVHLSHSHQAHQHSRRSHQPDQRSHLSSSHQLPSPETRSWEERFPVSAKDRGGTGRGKGRQSTMDDLVPIPSTPMRDHQGWPQSEGIPSFWSHHESFSGFPTPNTGTATDNPPQLPARSLSITDLPRNPNGSKKQQSGRKRTACDRCKRQKSSVGLPPCEVRYGMI